MISVDDLWKLLDDHLSTLPSLPIPLAEAGGLVLDEPVFADADQPAFDRSAMDGFAILQNSTAGIFQISGDILPGEAAPSSLGKGEAWRVYTGSALPPGVRVIRQEDALASEGKVRIAEISGPSHVRLQGSGARKGELLLPKGTLLNSAERAIAAGAGIVSPMTIPKPRVFHLTTGREVVPHHASPGAGQIRDTNGPLIAALVREAGAELKSHRHAEESVDACLEAAKNAHAEEADILLVSGGSSVGDHDGTAAVLERLGFSLRCRRVNCRPGKPLLVGFRGSQVAFGIPGNPVSHFVAFHLFVRRAIDTLRGRAPQPLARSTLESDAWLETDSRETFWPARAWIKDCGLRTAAVRWLDSGQLTALHGVNALLRLKPNRPRPGIGETMEVVLCGPPDYKDDNEG